MPDSTNNIDIEVSQTQSNGDTTQTMESTIETNGAEALHISQTQTQKESAHASGTRSQSNNSGSNTQTDMQQYLVNALLIAAITAVVGLWFGSRALQLTAFLFAGTYYVLQWILHSDTAGDDDAESASESLSETERKEQALTQQYLDGELTEEEYEHKLDDLHDLT